MTILIELNYCEQQESWRDFNFGHVRTSATRLRVAVTLHEDVGANLNLELGDGLNGHQNEKKTTGFFEKNVPSGDAQ